MLLFTRINRIKESERRNGRLIERDFRGNRERERERERERVRVGRYTRERYKRMGWKNLHLYLNANVQMRKITYLCTQNAI